MKKVLSIVLALAVIMSVLPLGILPDISMKVAAVSSLETGKEVIINGVSMGYKTGEMWDGTGECFGYANYCQSKLDITVSRNYPASLNDFKSCCTNGAHVRFSRGSYEHSLVIVSSDSNNVVITDANWSTDRDNLVRMRIYNWDELYSLCTKHNSVWVDSATGIISPNNHVDLGDDFIAIIYPSQRSHVEVMGNNNGNVELVEEKGNSNERWKFQRNSDGSYYIRSMLNGGYLDVMGAYTDNGTNVHICGWTGSDAQRWYICESDLGYIICPKHCESMALDCSSSIQYGSNVKIWDIDDTVAQGFYLWKTDNQVDVNSGIYKIHSAWNDGQYMDIAGNSKEDRANIQLYQKENTNVQEFRIIKHDSYYTIKSVYSGKYLDIQTPISNNSNVQLWWSDENTEEKWVFEKAENGLVYIRSLTGYYLDVQGDNAINHANLQVYEFMGNNSQKWRLEDCTPLVNPEEGTYVIHSARNYSKVLDVAGNSTENRANIQLFDSVDAAQKFKVVKQGNYYAIKSAYAGKWLDIRTPIEDNANVQLWESNSNIEEKWMFEDAGNGYVYLKSLTGYYLDLQGDSAVNHANIQVYHFIGNDSQRWKLEKITYPKPIMTVTSNTATLNTPIDFNYGNVTDANEVKLFFERDGSLANSISLNKSGSYQYLFKTLGECKVYIGARYIDEWVYSDKITVNVKEHNFVNGFCTECGKVDYTQNLFGDYYLDGDITAVDGLMANKIGKGSIESTDDERFRIDVNADGILDSKDGELIINFVNGDINKSDWPVYDLFTGFSVKTEPKTEYRLGEEIDLTGMVLQANYKNGTIHTVSFGYTVSGYNPNHLGRQTVIVDYHGFKTSLSVLCRIESDANGDGKVDADDLIEIRNAILSDSGEYSEALDVNGDGAVNILDLVHLKKCLAGV